MTHSDQPTPLEARSSGALTGKVRVPGDKSISHRALILGALAVGETRISGLLEGEDVLNTAKAMRALGARVERDRRNGAATWSVRGVGVAGFAQPDAPLDFGNSGTGCRLVMGAVAGCPIVAIFDGDASLRTRPMRRMLDPLELMGARVGDAKEGGRLPLTLAGRARSAADPLPHPGGVGADQVRGAAGGAVGARHHHGDRDRGQPRPYRTDAEAFWRADHVSTREGSHGRRIALTGQPELHGADVVVPADPSSAAFPIVAALIVEGSDIVLTDVMTNPLRTGLFTTLREMGASIEESEVRGDAGEPMAQFRVRASKLRGVEVPPERAPSMIDEYLVLAVAASFAEGTTIMRGLQELRVKESDRLEATAAMLRVNGVKVEIVGDDLIVEGRGHVPGGGLVATHMDHRIAMSALVMGLASDKPVKVDDTAFIATSFPTFIPMMRGLGAEFS